VSRRIADRFAHCRVGDSFQSGRITWHVVGIFDAHRTAYESEIWVDVDEARSSFKRDFYGSVLIRPVDSAAAERVKERILTDKLLSLKVVSETEYYREQTQSAELFRFLASFLAIIMSVGAAFAAMNTMYAAVGARTREIGTLRVLGIGRAGASGRRAGLRNIPAAQFPVIGDVQPDDICGSGVSISRHTADDAQGNRFCAGDRSAGRVVAGAPRREKTRA
jgi:hypothetical protein